MYISLSRIIAVITFIVLFSKLNGQQVAQYSLYMFDKYEYHAAYGGLDYSLSGNVHFRNQWQGLSQSPSSLSANAHLPFYIWSGALGVKMRSRSLGALRFKDLSFSYNYVLNLGHGLWSNGLRLGVSHLTIDGSGVRTPDGIYTGGAINHNDPILLPMSSAGIGLLWELSSYYKGRDLEVGVSLQGVPGNNIGLENYTFNEDIHLVMSGQYIFRLREKIDLMQSILLKSDFNQWQTEITSTARINGNIFGGIGIRGYSPASFDAIIVIMGMQISENVRLMYSYDAGISGIRRVNEGSHEILINYNLQKAVGTGRPPKIKYNTRYL